MERALRLAWSDNEVTEMPAPRPRVAADWPLISDVLTCRGGVPEHLLRWRGAEAGALHEEQASRPGEG